MSHLFLAIVLIIVIFLGGLIFGFGIRGLGDNRFAGIDSMAILPGFGLVFLAVMGLNLVIAENSEPRVTMLLVISAIISFLFGCLISSLPDSSTTEK